MDYINYVKQSPMSMGGMGGVVGSYNFRAAAAASNDCSGTGNYYGNRGLHLGGNNSPTDVIGYFNIPTTQNASNFGDLTVARYGGDACSTETRSVSAGGNGSSDTIDYVTVASTGNATDFGELIDGRTVTGCSNGVRGVWGGGYTGAQWDEMEFVCLDTAQGAADFGSLWSGFGAGSALAGGSNGERGIFMNGGSGDKGETIQYFDIETTGNCSDFGESVVSAWGRGGVSNTTRMVAAGGYYVNTMDYITIATTGNSSNFGTLVTNGNGMGGSNNNTRGVFLGGEGAGNVMQYITISSTSNSTDFGDSVNSCNNNYIWGDAGGGT